MELQQVELSKAIVEQDAEAAKPMNERLLPQQSELSAQALSLVGGGIGAVVFG